MHERSAVDNDIRIVEYTLGTRYTGIRSQLISVLYKPINNYSGAISCTVTGLLTSVKTPKSLILKKTGLITLLSQTRRQSKHLAIPEVMLNESEVVSLLAWPTIP